MSTISSLKDYISAALSASPLVDKVKYIFNPNTDTHFFQVVGVDIYSEPDLLDIIGTIYDDVELHFNGTCVAIVDGSSLKDFSDAELTYNSNSILSSQFHFDAFYKWVHLKRSYDEFSVNINYNKFINLDSSFQWAAEPIIKYQSLYHLGSLLQLEDDFSESIFTQIQVNLKADLGKSDQALSVKVEESLHEFEIGIEYLEAA